VHLSKLKICKWAKEIKTVGITNWIWFVLILKRNEFSTKLGVRHYWSWTSDNINWKEKLLKDRKKAHEIDRALEDII